MDAALMRESVTADDGLVVLHRERGRRRHQLRGARQLRGVDLVPPRELVVAHVDRHHDFLERGVAGPLADAVDGALDLPCAAAMPRSLWQCTEKTALSEFGTRSISVRMKWVYSSGVV